VSSGIIPSSGNYWTDEEI
jgi:hypothetical protein